MKNIFLTFISLAVFTACSSNNAYDRFNLKVDQERSISNMQRAKIIDSKGAIHGMFSAIYLNEVYPESFNDGENFFVYVYLKKDEQMYNPKEYVKSKLNVMLNSKYAVKIEELPRKNRFSHLVQINSTWNKYYLITFLHDKKDKLSLSLTLESEPPSSAVLKYQKAE
jgi:hypothetical protein